MSAPETLRDRIRRAFIKWRDHKDEDARFNGWRAMFEVLNVAGRYVAKDTVRGVLVELTAEGSIEPKVFSNGIYWRAVRAPLEGRD